jgi:predicted Mrr-cat superfamily restriction endonuclease
VSIYEVPSERRYWVVRAEGGFYFDHFTKHGVIALGHINIINLPNSKEEDAPIEWGNLQNLFKARLDTAPEIKRGGLHLSQVKSFLYEMKVGDWVMTVRSGAVCFGRIIGKPFVDKDPLVIIYDPERGPKIEMDMHLRRCVE